ncbi:uncharacterized protein LOC114343388 isoform X1 [Diabrotica virgifera virgifera]|uniref:Uncharacterized protein n=1 Tax=Diabrotica virgifera virgifera TaxID=50390 RepID=A0ABM5IYQ7_DIAVI|nr:uncharacterized protein LOC114343388 isoform X1 [Diabrotica virgifera virgifera]
MAQEIALDNPELKASREWSTTSDSHSWYPRNLLSTSYNHKGNDLSSERKRSQRGTDVINFIDRNIRRVSETQKIEYDIEEPDYICSRHGSRKSSTPSTKSPPPTKNNRRSTPIVEENLPKHTENKTVMKDVTQVSNSSRGSKGSNNSQGKNLFQKYLNEGFPETENKSNGNGYGKYNIKKTTCKACMEKWREPLPTPKTPKVKKSSVVPNIEDYPLKTNSKHRVDMLINKELYTLDSYNRRFSSKNGGSRSSTKDRSSDSHEYANRNPMILAKKQQEIRNKEAQKKVERFLKEPIEKK